MKKAVRTYTLLLSFAFMACNDIHQPETDNISQNTREKAAINWVKVNDMAENSFSIDMPAGWKNAAFIHRRFNSPRSLVTSVAPDKSTVIYLSDPGLPLYALPDPQIEASYRQMGISMPYQSMNYVIADDYFNDYLQKRFGSLEGFRITEKFDNKPLLKLQEHERSKLTTKVEITNASYRFEYISARRTIYGELNGCTMAMGNIWLPELSGFCTTGAREDAENIMLKMLSSRVSNPKWQEEQNAKHQQTMAMINENSRRMTQQHEQNMANIQSSSAAHQQRMAAMQQSHDQWNSNWSANQAAQDRQHEKFINSIKEEHTVAGADGKTYQVDNKNSKYFVDKTNNTYIGADGTTSLDDLRKIQGLNIDHFEEVQIIR